MSIQSHAAAIGALAAACLVALSGCGAGGQTGAAPSGTSPAPAQATTIAPASASPTPAPAAAASPSPAAPITSVTAQGQPTPVITQPNPAGTTVAREPPMPLPPGLSGAPGASATASGSGTARLQLTQADDGKTVQARVGETIYLTLMAPQGFTNWDVAPPDGKVLVGVPNPAAAAVRGATLRAFRAAAAGQTEITGTSKPDCQPGQACAQIIRLYRVTVTVSG